MLHLSKRKSIVVTGGAGFVGSYLVPALLKAEPHCIIKVLDNLQRGHREFVKNDPRVRLIQVDIKDIDSIDEHFKDVDFVFHLASVVGGVKNVFQNEANVFHDTSLVNLNVISMCRKYKSTIKRVIYLSTACCYPKEKQAFRFNKDGTTDINFLKEEDVYPADPESGYGMAKLFGEQLCEKLLDKDVYHIVRLHNLYGPRMACDDTSQVTASLIRKVLKITNDTGEKILNVWGCGEQYRDFIFIGDAIEGIMEVYIQNPIDVRVIQLGSGMATTINSLAKIICDIHCQKQGIKDIQIVNDRTEPEGDSGRVADISLARKILNWKTITNLEKGLEVTYDYFSKLCLAICLPITSKGFHSLSDAENRLQNLVLDISSHVFIGIDQDDPIYNLPEVNQDWFEQILSRPCYIRKFTKEESKKDDRSGKEVPYIYGMYNLLIKDADDAGMEYAVLWGDDIKIDSNNWLPDVVEKFKKFNSSELGVVALSDSSSPGMATFPIVNRKHVEIFNGFCPPQFINQDADPWVYAVYRRFNCSSFIDISIRNKIGGTIETGVEARYARAHLENWRNLEIEPAVQLISQYTGNNVKKTKTVTLDVITPTYRTNLKLLENIICLKDALIGEPDVSVKFIIIVDNPLTNVRQELIDLSEKYAPFVLLRFNSENMGAGCTRNRGLDESDAEHVLFLDDDVDVAQNPKLLIHYVDAIRKYKNVYCGFVGCTIFPKPSTIQEIGFIMSYCSFFWNVAERNPHPAWGVTANVCLKRSNVRFHDDFIKTGGGEDIQFCIDTQRSFKQKLVSVPDALVIHPYWKNFSVKHFFNWTQGDGLLIDKYPEFTYYNYPTLPEMLLIELLLWLVFILNGWKNEMDLSTDLSMHMTFCFWLMYTMIVEIVMDLHHYHFIDPNIASDSTDDVTSRMLGSLQATFTKNVVEAGHLWIHLKRGKIFNLGNRFDWNCGIDEKSIKSEIEKAGMRFALIMVLPLAWILYPCCRAMLLACNFPFNH